MSTTEPTEKTKQQTRKKPWLLWLIYISAILSGVVLLTHAMGVTAMQKVSARLGIALVYSALSLVVGGTRWQAVTSAVLIWAAVIVTFFI